MSTIPGLPTASFAIGTSSTTAGMTTENKVDMSLDDIISSRRQEERASTTSNRRTTRSQNTANTSGNVSSLQSRSIGRTKAKRAAAMNARRGMQASSKPTKAQVEKEVNRAQRRGRSSADGDVVMGGTPSSNTRSNTRRPRRSAADVKVKAKAQAERKRTKKNNSNSNTPTPTLTQMPPTRKAMNAAVDAMKGAGFKVPDGMQVVISFAPTAALASAATRGGGRNRNNNQKKK